MGVAQRGVGPISVREGGVGVAAAILCAGVPKPPPLPPPPSPSPSSTPHHRPLRPQSRPPLPPRGGGQRRHGLAADVITGHDVTPAVTSPPARDVIAAQPRKAKAKGPFVCGLCAKEFKNGYNLRRHSGWWWGGDGGGGAAPQRRPPARKSHACDTCGKAFRDVYHLKRHRLSHTDERPFQCPVCQQRFKRKDRMASHVRSHQGHVHKPYACGHCGKSFSRPDHLNSHVRQVHSTERPFKCQTCEAAFATRDRLRAHAVRHEEKVPCHVCGKLLSAAYVGDHLRVHGPHGPHGHPARAQQPPRGSGCAIATLGPSPLPGPAPWTGPPGSQGW
ncbi:LOW QUALITY PROTEIN: myc-associated zinc finger protein [Myiozetetes cayanensis]|uniref:LOW QUALITY PROTEIN: myc-associated zinc finger protein n=1 Tax=Myiozetetes cayanensis TaxID=478635 RepID=UPI00215FD90D|nr:LOW QUALITY PROTEIN: myc-associated zinc finger protein [Myiozetetes cayanensis]